MDKSKSTPPSLPVDNPRSEDAFGKTWDRCITDLLVKMGGGLGLGVVFSVVLFGRRAWPLFFGVGSGFGMAYNNCQAAFNEPFSSRYIQSDISSKQQESSS